MPVDTADAARESTRLLDEVHVLEAERRAALRDQLRQLCGRVRRRLWASKAWIALALLTAAVAVVWL